MKPLRLKERGHAYTHCSPVPVMAMVKWATTSLYGLGVIMAIKTKYYFAKCSLSYIISISAKHVWHWTNLIPCFALSHTERPRLQRRDRLQGSAVWGVQDLRVQDALGHPLPPPPLPPSLSPFVYLCVLRNRQKGRCVSVGGKCWSPQVIFLIFSKTGFLCRRSRQRDVTI